VLAEQGEERRVSQAAAIALDDEGGVRAIVGGRDYDQSQFNRATQARRQPGSSFKYFIYLAAMENGLTPWSVREDAPITISIPGQPDWTPGNYTNEFHGAVDAHRRLHALVQHGRHPRRQRSRRRQGDRCRARLASPRRSAITIRWRSARRK
jgi:membrane carboxypeptidase/penicillin-binding protein